MAPMAQAGEEAVGSMGNDSPLAVMSNKNKTLYHYFKSKGELLRELFAIATGAVIASRQTMTPREAKASAAAMKLPRIILNSRTGSKPSRNSGFPRKSDLNLPSGWWQD